MPDDDSETRRESDEPCAPARPEEEPGADAEPAPAGEAPRRRLPRVPAKIGEDRDNLRRRGEWFRERTGDPDSRGGS
jgi:hypothetical protein